MKAGLRREMIFCNSIFWGRLSAFAAFALSASGLVIQAAYAEENSFADKLTGQWGGWRTTLFNQGIDLEIVSIRRETQAYSGGDGIVDLLVGFPV
ncbi:hypothetical protein LHT11_13760, partial [Acetobacter indonesiensis]|nr:hypothetical protein [Acetobacter indonesiensis]